MNPFEDFKIPQPTTSLKTQRIVIRQLGQSSLCMHLSRWQMNDLVKHC